MHVQHSEKILRSLYLVSSRLHSTHFPLLTFTPFTDFALYPFIVRNCSCGYNYILSPVRPFSKSPNLNKHIINSLRARTIPNNKILSILENFKNHGLKVSSNVKIPADIQDQSRHIYFNTGNDIGNYLSNHSCLLNISLQNSHAAIKMYNIMHLMHLCII